MPSPFRSSRAAALNLIKNDPLEGRITEFWPGALELARGNQTLAFTLEELHGTFVFLRSFTGLEGPEVAALPGLRVLLA